MLLRVISLKNLTLFHRSCSKSNIFRLFSSQKLFGEKLVKRGLIKISGKDTRDFLQGLITNDIRHLTDGSETSVSLPCIYSMVLNVQGRLLYDIILYKVKENSTLGDCLLLECDTVVIEDIMKHFLLYRLRKKVDLKIAEDVTVHAMFQENSTSDAIEAAQKNEKDNRIIFISRDPRLPALGHRVILERNCKLSDVIVDLEITPEDDNKYRNLRYSLGVGEGIHEHSPGECFPLECNGDYLHGVSFTKGCYVGQELTSRIHHTGVVRKRVMPFNFKSEVQYHDIPANCPVLNDVGKNVGKFRNCGPVSGIALLRVDEVLLAKTISLKGFGEIYTFKPNWWPLGT